MGHTRKRNYDCTVMVIAWCSHLRCRDIVILMAIFILEGAFISRAVEIKC